MAVIEESTPDVDADEWLSAIRRRLLADVAVVARQLDPSLAGPRQAVIDSDIASPLDVLVHSFGLSPFEVEVLLLCAGVELDVAVGRACGTALGLDAPGAPTWRVALDNLAGPDWGALSPDSPLRRWELITVDAGATTADSRLRIDESILHFLCGFAFSDPALAGVSQSIDVPETALVPSHERLAQAIMSAWQRSPGRGSLPLVVLSGRDARTVEAVAATAYERLGGRLLRLDASVAPGPPADRARLAMFCERQAALTGSAYLLQLADTSEATAGVGALADMMPSVLAVAADDVENCRTRPLVQFEVPRPTVVEQREVWSAALGRSAGDSAVALDRVVAQFDLDQWAIDAIAQRLCPDDEQPAPAIGDAVWDACCLEARRSMGGLAQQISSDSTWDDLVLPGPQLDTLRALAAHVRHRFTVHDQWGFARRSSRGLGITSLFSGASGTGKTLAAEVVTAELGLELYRVDLSQVVSKYVGETEKNLGRIFDSAEGGGCVLLFDEADGLFGKRGEVRDGHDRYANLEVNYLLQRMETFAGLAILTTNLSGSIDPAFQRRIRYIVQFPFPVEEDREAMWRRAFPADAPLDGINFETLAGLHVAGGAIRNIALQAAFIAADQQRPISMPDLLTASHREYAKLEKTLSSNEVRGWDTGRTRR